jgi:uncharacterized protein YwgA
MTNYQLAKLVLLAGGLESRKRLQKTVHLLQAAGADFGLRFRLHYYGPYCAELAEKVDRMTANGMLQEFVDDGELGPQYRYELSEDVVGSLEGYEKGKDGKGARTSIEKFSPLLDDLGRLRPRVLELASTIVFFRQAGHDRDEAVRKTSEFKQEGVESDYMRQAQEVAERALTFDG